MQPPSVPLDYWRRSGTLVCIECPPAVEVGIDMQSWTVGEKFRGIKMVPPGTHLVTSAPSDGAARASFFIHVHSGEVLCARWDKRDESLQFPSPDLLEHGMHDRICSAVHSLELDRFLGQYPGATWPQWAQLASFICPRVLRRLQPAGKVLFDACSAEVPPAAAASAVPTVEVGGTLTRGDDAPAAVTPAPPPASAPCSYTRIAGVGPGASPEERTRWGVDTTAALAGIWRDVSIRSRGRWGCEAGGHAGDCGQSLRHTPLGAACAVAAAAASVGREGSGGGGSSACTGCAVGAHVLGELQFAFAGFLVAQSYAAFTQWKHLLDVLCRCDAAQQQAAAQAGPADSAAAAPPHVAHGPDAAFFAAACGAIAAQCGALPPDFFRDELSSRGGSNFLAAALGALARNTAVAARAAAGRRRAPPVHAASVLRLCEAAAAHFSGGWRVPGADELGALLRAQQQAEAAEQRIVGGGGAGGDSPPHLHAPLAATAEPPPKTAGSLAIADTVMAPTAAERGAAARARAILRQAALSPPQPIIIGAGAGTGGTGAAASDELQQDQQQAAFSDMASLLEGLRDAGGDGDLPTIELGEGDEGEEVEVEAEE